MRNILLAAVVAFTFTSCTSDQPPSPPASGTKTDAGKLGDAVKDAGAKAGEAAKGALAAATKLEVACAHCQYHVAGVSSCKLGVKVADKAYEVSGVDLDVSKLGLCSAPKQATVEGKVEGGKFVATKVDLVK